MFFFSMHFHEYRVFYLAYKNYSDSLSISISVATRYICRADIKRTP